MQAEVGDMLIVRGHKVGDPERRAKVLEVRGSAGGPPYIVAWEDDRSGSNEHLFFPGSDVKVIRE
ncbi:MAG: hypothetical protein JJLCMIEE_00360 [Acidimicrobiales bacterium]|nr:MAG: DUF1918 domain-containing protein [Actinomycetota bacterium]MBV6507316.1 hypothetical protein [Acidimicrobiales bacterium]RIK02961.1 MAG: DUF1918 domain-containing protein [Acidobacteriota bacterium]